MFRVAWSERRKFAAILLLALGSGIHAAGAGQADAGKGAAANPDGPTDAKAQKTFASAIKWEKQKNDAAALDDFRKANKQDGGQCAECLRRALDLAVQLGQYKDSVDIAREWLPLAKSDADKVTAHFQMARSLQSQGINEKKDKYFSESCDELKAALELNPKFATAHYLMGVSLAHLHQDDAARAEFNAFLSQDKDNPSFHPRAKRFVERVDLARAVMTPPFSIITIDGQHVSMDNLEGKVVLIDFWATWCGPCKEALPHIKQIAHKFEGQPLVVLSVSLDSDEGKWKEFVGKNGMTWLQYRDGGFSGPIATRFGVRAIPATFTIDTDGVLEDQHVGDADIDGKLKKLVAQAVEKGNRQPAATATEKAPGGAE